LYFRRKWMRMGVKMGVLFRENGKWQCLTWQKKMDDAAFFSKKLAEKINENYPFPLFFGAKMTNRSFRDDFYCFFRFSALFSGKNRLNFLR
jgi:hypothetical protein